MSELTDLDLRMRALETRIASIGVGRFDPGVLNSGATQCGTGVCTSCRVDDAVNILLPGVDRPMSGREITSALKRLAELEKG